MTGLALRAAAVRLFLGSARLLAALIAAQGVRWLCAGRHERAVVKMLALKSGAAPERAKGKPVEAFDKAVMEHGMLGPGPQPLHLQGILGSEALFGTSPDDAQPMKVGDALPDGRKIVEIKLNEVVLEKDGQRQTETVFDQFKPAPPVPDAGPPPKSESQPAKKGNDK